MADDDYSEEDLIPLGSVLDELERDRRLHEQLLANELTWVKPQETGRLEAQVIAGLMERGNDGLAEAIEAGLSAAAFTTESMRAYFELAVKLRDRGDPIDRLAIEDLALEEGMVGRALKIGALDRVEFTVDAPTSLVYSARMLAEAGRRREVWRALKEHEAQLRTGRRPDDVLDSAQATFLAMSKNARTDGHADLRVAVREACDEMPAAGGSPRYISSGFKDLDELVGGFTPGELILLAARPSMGKTALALSVAHKLIRRDVPVAFFSLEMSTKTLMTRLIGIDSGVPPRKQHPRPNELSAVVGSAGELAEAPLYVNDRARHLADIRAQSRRLVAVKGVGAIFIDYLQLVKVPSKDKRHLEVGEISRSLKELAHELDVPLIALSQLSRQSEGRAEKRPVLSDLRESGDLEQDADVVALLYREGYYRRQDGMDPNEPAEVIFAKNRNGPTGTVKLAYRAAIPAFADLAFRDTMF